MKIEKLFNNDYHVRNKNVILVLTLKDLATLFYDEAPTERKDLDGKMYEL